MPTSPTDVCTVVGYSGNPAMVAGKFNMLNVPFTDVAAGGYFLNKNFTGTGFVASDDSSTSDQIQYWRASDSGYDIYWYFEGGVDEDSGDVWPMGWYGFDSGELFETDYPDGFTPGKPFWYISIGKADLDSTDSGAVATEASYTFPIVMGKFNMFANPYPVALKLNESFTTVGTVASDDSSTSDQIQFWRPNDSGYDIYWLFEGGVDEDSGDVWPLGWYGFDSGELFETDYPDGVMSTKPFWLISVGKGENGSITFTNPIK